MRRPWCWHGLWLCERSEGKKYINALWPNVFVMEREGSREGLFNWCWVGEKQRGEDERQRGVHREIDEDRSHRSDDDAVEKQQI